MRKIVTTFEIVTPESAELGDVAETGWEDEEGVEISPDDADTDIGETVVDVAVRFLKNNGGELPSSSQFHPGMWYSQPDSQIDYRTGAEKRLSFHLVDFSEQEQRDVFERMTGKPSPFAEFVHRLLNE